MTSDALVNDVEFSSHEPEIVKERVGEKRCDDADEDLERREAVGKLRLFDSVNVSLSIVSEMKSADNVCGGLMDNECDVGVIEQVEDSMIDSLCCETETEMDQVGDCVKLTLALVILADADSYSLESDKVEEYGADSVAVGAFLDCNLTTPSALYGIIQISLPSKLLQRMCFGQD